MHHVHGHSPSDASCPCGVVMCLLWASPRELGMLVGKTGMERGPPVHPLYPSETEQFWKEGVWRGSAEGVFCHCPILGAVGACLGSAPTHCQRKRACLLPSLP